MPTPVRIVIDIRDMDNFDWDTAFGLWANNFPLSSKKQGMTYTPGYAWFKVDPETGKPEAELTNGVKYMLVSEALAEPTRNGLREEIDALASAVYKMKREMQSGKTPNPRTVAAIENTIRATYSRWAALDVPPAEGIEDIAEVAKPKRTRAKKPVVENAEQAFMRYLDTASAQAAAQAAIDARRAV